MFPLDSEAEEEEDAIDLPKPMSDIFKRHDDQDNLVGMVLLLVFSG